MAFVDKIHHDRQPVKTQLMRQEKKTTTAMTVRQKATVTATLMMTIMGKNSLETTKYMARSMTMTMTIGARITWKQL